MTEKQKQAQVVLLGAWLIGLALTVFFVRIAGAAPSPIAAQATSAPTASSPQKACADCHPNVQAAWMDSPHAHSADNPVFLKGWETMERSPECFLCHKATFDETTGEYNPNGTTCETCHGTAGADHPPSQVATRSDAEYCGTCHPATLGESRLSGHSAPNEVRCADCHDPHSQKVLFEKPDDMCKDCHDEDLGKMEDALGKVHLQGSILCVDCHTLDVPHTFLLDFQHEDTNSFFNGFDCTSDIASSAASRIGSSHEAPGSYIAEQMNWPIVHRVSRVESATQCSDCHVMDEKLRADFIALGYSSEDLDQIAWESDDYPALTEAELNKLIAAPRQGWSWIYWLIGIAAVFGVFEISVARNLEDAPPIFGKTSLVSLFRRLFARYEKKNNSDQKGEE